MQAFDSATFKKDDFDGLRAFGRGGKRFDPTKTGKFGLGFNSVSPHPHTFASARTLSHPHTHSYIHTPLLIQFPFARAPSPFSFLLQVYHLTEAPQFVSGEHLVRLCVCVCVCVCAWYAFENDPICVQRLLLNRLCWTHSTSTFQDCQEVSKACLTQTQARAR